MITTHCTFYIAHDGHYYKLDYSVTLGETSLYRGGATIQESYYIIDKMQFVCDTRKAAEIFLQAYISQQKRKLNG